MILFTFLNHRNASNFLFNMTYCVMTPAMMIHNTRSFRLSLVFAAALSLASAHSASATELKPGDVVVDSADHVGVVERVLPDGRAEYRIGDFTYMSRSLSKETETHPSFSKSTLYATDRFQAGYPVRFFENLKIQIQLLNGTLSIEYFLHDPTRELEGHYAGIEVLDARGRRSIVRSVFDNGTLVVDHDGRTTSGKIKGFFRERNRKRRTTLEKFEDLYWQNSKKKQRGGVRNESLFVPYELFIRATP